MACTTPQVSYDWVVRTEVVGDTALQLEGLRDFDDAVALLCERIRDGGDPRWFEDRCPMFGTIWPAARALARRVAAPDGPGPGARVLELGCGLALPSLVAARRGAAVLATDQHPDAAARLARNAARNGVRVDFAALDWRDPVPDDAAGYDWVLASDVLYAAGMAELLLGTFARWLAPGGRGVLADPGRPWLQDFAVAAEAAGFRVALDCTPDDVFLLELTRPGRSPSGR
ncbi:MAG: methyltransferase domain-containing protein [Myxococcota bacterium]